jgi:hypothetical protein
VLAASDGAPARRSDVNLLKLIVVLLPLLIFPQTIYGYYAIDQTFSAGDEDTSGILLRVVSSLPIFVLAGYLFVFRSANLRAVPGGHRWIVLLSMWVLITGVFVGLLRQNDLRYLLGDTFRYLITWVTMYIALIAVCRLVELGERRFLLYAMDILAVLFVMDAVAGIYLSLKFPGNKISAQAAILGIFWALFQDRWPRWLSGATVILCLAATLMNGKRASLIGLVLLAVWAVYLSLFVSRRRAGAIVATFAVSALLGWLVLPLISPSVEQTFSSRFSRTFETVTGFIETDTDVSFAGRRAEIDNVREFFDDSPSLILLGGGFGAQTPMYIDTGVVSNTGDMHQVHIAWGAYYLRNGIFGLLLLAVFWLVCLMQRAFTPSTGDARWTNWHIITVIFLGNVALHSLSSQTLLEDIGTPIFAALALGFALPENRRGGAEALAA